MRTLPKKRTRKNIFDLTNLSSSFVEETPKTDYHQRSQKVFGKNTQDEKMKNSQVTAVTHDDNTLHTEDKLAESSLF